MNGRDHRVLGAAAGVGVVAVSGLPGWVVAPAAVVGSVSAGGVWSPDRDQRWQGSGSRLWWRLEQQAWRVFAFLVCVAPWWRSGLGRADDPTAHRGITHWWGVPAVWAAAVAVGQWRVPGPLWWVAWWLIAGWVSHLVGDWVAGRQVYGQRGHGVPLAPWWRHAGLPLHVGLRSDGPGAHVFTYAVALPVGVWAALVALGLL